jgi:tRNA threonylcarbamoyladenosine biosynthesis protein TsaE
MKTYIAEKSKQTQKLGELLAGELKGGEILALEGDLGAGKTTFTQGLLKGLKVKGPYTSPTFLIIKNYKKKFPISNLKFQNIFHIDAYRVKSNDILNLGWEEIIADKKNIVIIEWADRISKIIPDNAIRIKFEWVDENKRKLKFLTNK